MITILSTVKQATRLFLQKPAGRRSHYPLLLCFLALLQPAHAQWQTTTYNLKGGWNSIYLHGDASHASPDVLFATGDAAKIEEVWRWNTNPTQVGFTTDPLLPTPGTPEWSTWNRGNPGASTLTTLTGQSAYLIKCTGTAADTYSVPITHRPQPPSSDWVRNGANLLGFPSYNNGGIYPNFSTYFATFPAPVAANTKIYKYVGGELGPGNPLQVFTPAFEPLDRNQAYWFDSKVVGNFYAPIEISPSIPAGLNFGRTRSIIAVRLRNRSDKPVSMTISPEDSGAVPAGQTAVTGPVPLTHRTFNLGTGQFEETAISAAFTEVIPPESSITIEFGIDRGLMSANSNDFYASFLRFTDSGNLMEVYLPASAQPSSLAGLWIGDAQVTEVTSTVPGSPGATTLRPFPLRYLMHIDDTGTARLLSQVYIGSVALPPNDIGVCLVEEALEADSKASAMRLSAAHMPLDLALAPSSGAVALGGTAQWVIGLPFQDKVNPFVHQYHPDHDNKRPNSEPAENGEESHTVTRTVNFEFLASAPQGTSGVGWGATVLGGIYSETVTGVHKLPLTTGGTFTFRRVNDIGVLSAVPAP